MVIGSLARERTDELVDEGLDVHFVATDVSCREQLGRLGAQRLRRGFPAQPRRGPAAAPAAAGSVTLKSLSGVGPAMEKRMIALGVNNIEDLKGLSEEKIAAMTAEDAKISADQWGKWMEEAKSL